VVSDIGDRILFEAVGPHAVADIMRFFSPVRSIMHSEPALNRTI
jgi:hypothetical protein